MSTRFDVIQAVKALVALALPNADVLVLDNDDAVPRRPAPGGRAVVRAGDPGEPEIDLSPLAYNYEHEIPVELTAWRDGDVTEDAILDTMMVAIGERIEANRTLDGLVEWIEARSPVTEDIYFAGAGQERRAEFAIVATYATSNPLT